MFLSKDPIILDTQFLSNIEIADIKNKVFSLRNLWQENQIKSFYFLPYGFYSVKPEIYKKNVFNYKNLMYNCFENYYIKILNALNSNFEIEFSYHNNLNYPGFHVSKESMNVPNFHTDFFPELSSTLNGVEKLFYRSAKILSFVIPISISSNQSTGLLIRNNFDNSRTSLNYSKMLNYTEGILAAWQGNVIHSIKPFEHKKDNPRITMQFHAAIQKNQGIIFW